jgi:hypothetical protein
MRERTLDPFSRSHPDGAHRQVGDLDCSRAASRRMKFTLRLGSYVTATLNLGEHATSVARDHGVEVVDRRVHVHVPARCSVDHRAIGNE